MQDIYHLGASKPVRSLIAGAFNFASQIGLKNIAAPRLDNLHDAWLDFKEAVKDEPLNLRRHWRAITREKYPEAQIQTPTFGWIASAFDMSKKILDEDALSHVKTPVTIISAGKDDLVDNRAHDRAIAALPHATHHTIEGARHGLWYEGDGNYKKLLGYLDDFLKDPAARSTSPITAVASVPSAPKQSDFNPMPLPQAA